MFKDEADFEKVVGRLNIDTKPNPAHKQKLRRQMLSVFNQAEQKPATRKIVFRTLRRIIMKSPITKIATAATIIIAVSICIHYMGGSLDGASVAWSQVVEQLNNYTKYKCRQRVVREQGPEYPTMNIYHLNLQQRRQEVEDGSIHIIDMRSENPVTVELYPDQKKAVVTNILGFGPKKDPDIIDMVKRFEQQSTERLGTKNVNGKTLQGFRHKPNEYNDFTVWVDPKTKLPVEIELKHPQAGQTIFMDEFEFDFDLDESAFSTEVPDGYEVKIINQDYRPVEPKQITPEDIRSELSHTAYTIEKLPWMEKLIIMQFVDPLMGMGKVYVIGIRSDDGNMIIIVQGNYYEEERMVWIPKEKLVMETPSGVKLYTHPRGSEYALAFLKAFAKVNSEFFNIENLSEERFTRMIVMPDRMIMGLSVNKQMSDEKLQELVESLKEIKAN
jgi:outer membrane lipoprotein-sorting protein